MLQDEKVHYNKQQLEKEIQNLVGGHESTLSSKPIESIDPLLEISKEILTKAYRELARAAKENRELSTAAEWLIDNFYIIQEQIVQIKEDLPSSYYKKLPRLTEGEYRGFPRIYELIQVLATVSDNVIDRDNATIAVQAYQELHTLKIGELWGVPIMIRLVLLVRLTERVNDLIEQRAVRERVNRLLETITGEEDKEPGLLLRKLPELIEKERDERTCLCALAQQMQVQGMLTDTERSWFDYRFKSWDTTLEQELRNANQRTSRLQLSIQNAISSLREVAESDWRDFVENNSIVERILKLDPSGYYSNMDFNTRDRYRKIVEKLSANSSQSEPKIAEQALLMTEEASRSDSSRDNKAAHIGYYLIGDGFTELAAAVDYSMPLGERMRRWSERHPVVYFGSITICLAVLLAIVAWATGLMQMPTWVIVITLGAALIPALDLAVVSVNRLLSLLLPPRIMPKLKITGDIRDELRTMVVVPTLFSSPEDVRAQFESLEIRALANPNRSLQFALLSDFTDAAQETTAGDDAILEAAVEEVQNLNARYDSNYGDKFYLLHRKRKWNENQERWMGWERKRGKLEELNELLKNPDASTTYTTISGDFLESIQKVPVRYVITLDADTQMPPGSALKLISTAGHPLNRAEVDEEHEKVVRGYGIFQPRISITPKSANRSMFAKIFSGNVGIDPYTTAVSDVYQDFFGEGVFTGKGLYDVDLFDRLLRERFPDNTVLSHDLLESTYLRTALLSDIEFFDDYPTNYLNYSKRNHRWIRGDWQILYWIFKKVPSGRQEKEGNPINKVSRWKVFDNLRRSLNPLFLLLFLLAGWFLLPGSPLIWTAAALGITAFPIYSSFTMEIFRRPVRVQWKLYLEKIRDDIKINTVQAITTFLFMPHQAYVAVDAISRTLWRMFVSKNKLLEWTSASQVERESRGDFRTYWEKMWINIAWSILCIVLVWIYKPIILILVAPFAVSWMAAPALAYSISQRHKTEETSFSADEIKELRIYARQTWHYFEKYVNEDHSWLPPDNFQEEPYIGAVSRTSPTNMGLALVATYTAYEFGYITISELLDRLGNMLGSMKLLDRHKGHFFNWYSTLQGQVLNPRYISTVDSGNLAASLVIVKQGLLRLGEKKWLDENGWNGLRDTARVLEELTQELESREKGTKDLSTELSVLIGEFKKMIPGSSPEDIQGWLDALQRLQTIAKEIVEVDITPLQAVMEDAEFEALQHWYRQPLIQLNAQLDEIKKCKNGLKSQGGQSASAELTISEVDQQLPSGDWIHRAVELAGWCNQMVEETDFSMLYFDDRDLFSIGYNLDRASLDSSTYDQLATEARLASYIAIAKGDVPPKHWFRLSRRLTSIDRNEILLSWGGTMFEYLMPVLFMTQTEETLLSNTYENVVVWQKNYGDSRRKPWGFSESGYGVLNLDLNYQYRAFGAPGLGLRRGLAEDYVVTPYATMLALMILPKVSLENLRRLKEEGGYGLKGFYEAIDYSSLKGTSEAKKTVVQMYMAHHQAMSLLAMANVLKGNMIQNLFHRDPMVQSCEVLLQEKVPRGIPIKEPRPIDVELEPGEEQKVEISVDHAGQEALNSTPPRTHILSNGQYSTVITHSGTGYSSCDNMRLTRWRADRVQDPYGFFFYIKDLQNGEFWSMGHQPVGRKADRYDSWYHSGKMQIARVDKWIESFMEVCVSPEDNIELRKLTLTNYSQHPRRIEVTSYAEVVLNEAEADRAHPAFSNLFVQTDYIAEHHALIAKRRPRSEEAQPVWLVHTLASDDLENLPEPLQYETDRGKFIGRGRSLKNPMVMEAEAQLSGKIGNVPDPIVSMRRVVELQPGEKMNITFGLGKVTSREEAVHMANRYDNPYATDRVFELASIYGRVELEHIGLSGQQAHYFQKLAGFLIYGNRKLRANEDILKQNRRTQSALWAYGISGDLPILVYHIREINHLRTVESLLKAHGLWRLKGYDVDLVVINDHPTSYINELQDAIQSRIQSSMERQKLNKTGGVFVLRSDNIPREDLVLIDTVAAVVIHNSLPKIEFREKEEEHKKKEEGPAYAPVNLGEMASHDMGKPSDLQFYNGYGGFSKDGKEYVIHLQSEKGSDTLTYPPAPWINVLANSEFGCITSESGADYSWSQNSRENRLTPWSNDAVTDPCGDALYIRDDELGHFWSPTPGPVPGSKHYEIRHGFGYSRYKSNIAEIKQMVTKWVAVDDPVKIVRLRLSNTGLMAKELSIFRYLDWVLGVHREDSSHYLITNYSDRHQAIFARNFYNNEFAGRIAFASQYTGARTLFDDATADRLHFIGRNNSLANPRALYDERELNHRFGAGFDQCGAFQSRIRLNSGSSIDLYFLLGETASEEEARMLVEKYRDIELLESSFKEVKQFWRKKLGSIQVQTPAPELDIMMNGWLQYQNIACRIWARSGFYQSGGAFGFRDQLQDVSAALYMDTGLAREQILLHAAHQFPEGDVLHWWHPPTDRGTRTRISDDLLWLPYVTSLYIRRTGEHAILDEQLPFISARQLEENEQEAYLEPEVMHRKESLYEHCCLTIDRSLTKGAHGLPLIGAGDWNDSMNHVGEKGKGESVWLGFFLYKILSDFIPICKKRDDHTRVERYEAYQKDLKKHLNKEGWDGAWYRRAFYDDGTPMGSSESDECKIDAIAQSWAVISKAAPDDKALKALQSADRHLVSESEEIIRLLNPPFDRTEHNPGYIKGYIPGVRENGGQYTHAALWLVRAFAEKGFNERAVRLVRMLMPVNHSFPKGKADRYRVEPYAVAADIYSELPLTGMGGWTWYTGSAGWMYRVILESILGVELKNGNEMNIRPHIPADWEGFSITMEDEQAGTKHRISVTTDKTMEPGSITGTFNGSRLERKNTTLFKMKRDGKIHHIELQVGSSEPLKESPQSS
ncbi:GH36-type glycosyl hydrolase domain-containing protein [Fodinibius sediminis]|uniref:Cellobiose phosphorylase n=1 Tax=Fodinibius sediminis TaxID=1214077 RepID=A0A521CVJ8_9BACT|nr:glucoamylase family protein [Fodinibius sediminis]SMO63466.1 Cellobiose phosphorylase [Fodinibius sediminis]